MGNKYASCFGLSQELTAKTPGLKYKHFEIFCDCFFIHYILFWSYDFNFDISFKIDSVIYDFILVFF
jgi:hypothetical protein